MFLDTEEEEEEWFYRRDPRIRGKLNRIGRYSKQGIPYLSPEIQLLYKARADPLPKDVQDLQLVLPKLQLKAINWLKQMLQLQYPQGHSWIDLINDFLSDTI